MCGIAGVASLDGSLIPFETVFDAVSAMKQRGTEHGAGFASYNPAPLDRVRAKLFVVRGEEELVEKLVGGLTVENIGKIRLSNTVYIDERLLEDYPDPRIMTLLRFLQASRYLDVFKSIGWPKDVAKTYRLWGRSSLAWIGHTRYPTNSPGFQPWLAHPFTSYETAIVHNGDLSSYGANKRLIMHELGFENFTGNDSEVIAHLITALARDGLSFEDILDALIYGKGPRWARLDGPFAVIFIHGTPKGPVFGAFVDRHHFRPLYVAVEDHHIYVASEAAAIKRADPRARPRILRGGGYIILYPDGELSIRGLTEWKTAPVPPPPVDAFDARGKSSTEINTAIAEMLRKRGYAAVKGLEGQRYIANGLGPGKLELWGVLGNASLNLVRRMEVHVYGDAQEDIGDCAEDSVIAIYGNAGDSLAQAMRSGEVYVYGNAGNRVGVQMKGGYIVVGGDVGDYLGEFMAGGLILVLGKPGKYIGTGMVGGKIILRGKTPLTHVGIAPPRNQLEKLIRKLNEIGIIGREQLARALYAKTVDELREALGDAFRFVEKLWGSLHLGYPKPEYRYLHEDEQEIVRRLLEKFNMLFRAKIDIDSILVEKFTVITRSKT